MAKTVYGEDYDREDFYREDSPAKTCPRIKPSSLESNQGLIASVRPERSEVIEAES